MPNLHIDFETRSTCDLKREGLHRYARSPWTSVQCMAWAIDDAEVAIWLPWQDFPEAVLDHVRKGLPVFAHNAAFELELWNQVLTRDIVPLRLELEQMFCTMAMAYAMGLPGSLDDAAGAVGLEHKKDQAGYRVMLQLAQPRSVGVDGCPVWWRDGAKLQRLYDYCKQDVRVERALHARLLPLSADERAIWLMDQRINARGVPVDSPAIAAGIQLADAERRRLDETLRRVTGNAVAGCTDVAQLTTWLGSRGVATAGIAKADVTELLGMPLPVECRHALLLRQEAAKSSVAKYTAMSERSSGTGRMYGLFQYHGAATGRWAGRGPQPHNFARPTILHKQERVEDAIAHFHDAAYIENVVGAPLHVLADCLRGMICAPEGYSLACCDFSNIEGRVLAWLAGEAWKVEAFARFDAGDGPDIYKLAYARAFGIKVDAVTKDQRQIGKVMELALGYQGGVGAFQQMARGYDVKVEDAFADELKLGWRAAHPRVVHFWHALEDAATYAIRSGRLVECGPVKWLKKGSWLFCRLPSGRALAYPYPSTAMVNTPWGAEKETPHYWAQNSLTRKWERTPTYGGSLAENITQAVARDLLAEAMLRVEAAGYEIVMHVHDEIVVECAAFEEEEAYDRVRALMVESPAWAAGLPIAAAGWFGRRYRKA